MGPKHQAAKYMPEKLPKIARCVHEEEQVGVMSSAKIEVVLQESWRNGLVETVLSSLFY